MADFNALPTGELVSIYNTTFDKNVKKGSYTRKRMIADLEAAQPEPTTPEDDDAIACPSCGCKDDSKHMIVGEVGSFMGSLLECEECETTFSAITGEEVKVPAPKRRKLLNPQNQINKKRDALAPKGVEMKFDRSSKDWSFHDAADNGRVFHRMSSKKLAAYTPDSLVRLVVPKKDR